MLNNFFYHHYVIEKYLLVSLEPLLLSLSRCRSHLILKTLTHSRNILVTEVEHKSKHKAVDTRLD